MKRELDGASVKCEVGAALCKWDELAEKDVRIGPLSCAVDALADRTGAFADRIDALADRVDSFADRMDAFADPVDVFADAIEVFDVPDDEVAEAVLDGAAALEVSSEL